MYVFFLYATYKFCTGPSPGTSSSNLHGDPCPLEDHYIYIYICSLTQLLNYSSHRMWRTNPVHRNLIVSLNHRVQHHAPGHQTINMIQGQSWTVAASFSSGSGVKLRRAGRHAAPGWGTFFLVQDGRGRAGALICIWGGISGQFYLQAYSHSCQTHGGHARMPCSKLPSDQGYFFCRSKNLPHVWKVLGRSVLALTPYFHNKILRCSCMFHSSKTILDKHPHVFGMTSFHSYRSYLPEPLCYQAIAGLQKYAQVTSKLKQELSTKSLTKVIYMQGRRLGVVWGDPGYLLGLVELCPAQSAGHLFTSDGAQGSPYLDPWKPLGGWRSVGAFQAILMEGVEINFFHEAVLQARSVTR